MRVEKVINYVLNLLEEKLPAGLVYHLPDHTLDVVEAAKRLAVMERLDPQNQQLVIVSAALHDIGYVDKYNSNEDVAVKIAKEILPSFGFEENEISAIESAVLATKIPQTPQNIIAQIVCDADLDYLGREDFFSISEKLRNEWINFGLIDSDENKWNLIQYKFLSNHRYFTQSAAILRNHSKAIHLQTILTKISK